MSEERATKAYVDTTILAEVLLKKNDGVVNALSRFTVTELPEYAIKEFKAGVLSYWAWLHNKLVTTRSLGQTLRAIGRLFFQPNRQSSALEALSEASPDLSGFEPHSGLYGRDADRDAVNADLYRLALGRRIRRAWSRRRSVTSAVVLPLSCYEEQPPLERRGLIEIRPTKCHRAEECSVAAGMRKNPTDLRRLRDAIAKQPKTNENQRRSKALRRLARTPKRPIDDDTCRSLGDAVFAFFAPNDSIILTTNKKDHVPLAAALGKVAKAPDEIDLESP